MAGLSLSLRLRPGACCPGCDCCGDEDGTGDAVGDGEDNGDLVGDGDEDGFVVGAPSV